MNKQVFINLPVKDLNKSKAFFSSLGYAFNPQFTNEQGACMVISDTIYAMLLTEPFFQRFTNKPISDAKKSTEVLLCLSCDSRAAVEITGVEAGLGLVVVLVIFVLVIVVRLVVVRVDVVEIIRPYAVMIAPDTSREPLA